MIYLDYAATSPLDKKAADIYIKVATEIYGNESSLHDIGGQAKELLEHCRNQFAQALDIDPAGVFFTGGGSDGNFLAIEALLSSIKTKKKHIITSIAEHASIHQVMSLLKKRGYEITFLPFREDGQIDLHHLQSAIREDTALISIQHSNSELGVIQPIKEISALCRANHILFHSDFVHSFGKIDLSPIIPFVDSFTISAHKFYGPKGCGIVYLHPRINWQPYFPNTVHERGFKPGTVNVPAIAATITAAQQSLERLSQLDNHYFQLRKQFTHELHDYKDQWLIHENQNGNQLYATIGMRILGLEGQYIMLECNRNGVAISTGSACHTGLQTPTSSMIALGIETKKAKEFFRISFGVNTTANDITKLTRILKTIMQEHSYRNLQ